MPHQGSTGFRGFLDRNPFTALNVVQGVGRFASGLFGRRRRGPSPELELAEREAEEGAISGAAQREIVGEVASATGSIAAAQRTRARSAFAKAGLERSLVAQGALERPTTAQQTAVAGTAERIARENELSKVPARRRFAQLATQEQRAQEFESAQFRTGLIDAATNAVTGILEGRAIDRQESQAIISRGNTQQISRLRTLLSIELAKGAGANITPEIQALLDEILGRRPA